MRVPIPAYTTAQFLKDNNLSANLGYVQSSGEYRVKFTEEGFSILDNVIAWKDVYDWRYVEGDRYAWAKMVLCFYTLNGTPGEREGKYGSRPASVRL